MMIDVVEFDGPALMLRARGRINVLTASVFEIDALRAIADSDYDVIVDTSEVIYLSTAGLRVFCCSQESSKTTTAASTSAACYPTYTRFSR